MGYYVKKGDAEKGPYEESLLRSSLEDGTLKPTSLVRAEGSEDWVRLDSVVQLRPKRTAAEIEASAAFSDGARARRAEADRNVWIGGLICLIGVVVTVGSYSSASSGGGGRYVVAWGAIVFGAIRLFRGLAAR